MNDYDIPTLSIIVTVYNIEEYIAECIDSILRQDYTDYELIIIDDGSEDSGGDICDSYRGGRVRVVHTENRGVSEARNAGIELARGDYIFFVDGDDVMNKGMLKKVMLSVIDGGAAVTVLHLDAFDNETGATIDLGYGYNSQTIRYGSKPEIINELLSYEAIPWSPSGSVIKTELIKGRGLKYRTEAYGVEDCMFFLDVVRVCNSFAYAAKPLMRYRMNRAGSIMNTPNLLKLEARACVYERWIEYADELISSGGSGNAVKARMGNAFFYNVIQMYSPKSNDSFFDIVSTHKGILKYAEGTKKRLLYKLMSIIGVKNAIKLTVRGKYQKREMY